MAPAEQAAHDRHQALARSQVELATWDVEVAAGRGADLEDVIEEALQQLPSA
jgi:hypothetical protein